MKVGIFVSGYTQEIGGSFTHFESAVRSVCKTPSRHEFHLVTISGRVGAELRQNATGIVNLRNKWDLHICSEIVAFIRGRRMFGLGTLADALSVFRRRRIEAALREHRIEFLLCLQQRCPVLDFPYAITVLDIQHARQGFFPEVSYGNEWNRRQQFFEQTISRACFVIATNDVGKAEVERFCKIVPERIVALPHFVPDWAIAPPVGDGTWALKLGLVAGGFIFYPAQFWPHKNHAVIVRALAVLKERHGLVMRAVFTGYDMGNRGYIEQLVSRTGLDSQVTFLGFVSREQLAWLYKNALCLVYVSLFGPENLPPLEAMSLGCPVICAEFVGAREQLGGAALYFPPTDSTGLAKRLLDLRREGAAEQIAKGRTLASQRTPEGFAAAVIQALDEFEPIRNCWA